MPPAQQALGSSPAAAHQGKGLLSRLPFGGPSKADLAAENAALREQAAHTGALSAFEAAQELAAVQAQIAQSREQMAREDAQHRMRVAEAQMELSRLRAQVVETSEVLQLQEAGVYEYAHPLADAVAYKNSLARIKADTKALIKNGRAVDASTTWTVNNSAAEGRKMVSDFSKLLLRAYNAEADNCVRTVKPHTRKSALDRLDKAAATIAKLGRTMNISITGEYHRVRRYEIELTADHLAKVEEERERLREERERLREEQAAQREIEREKARLMKEQAHYLNALEKAVAAGLDEAAIADIKAKLADAEAEIERVVSREANTRAGWVYVISNVGAFGERMVKIGMTRRLEPMDRVRELGDASVPFRFDVHALVFTDDAVTLENRLHHELEDRRVNRINLGREFFYATPAEVKGLLAKYAGPHLLEYREDPEAAEWRASGSRRASDVFPTVDESLSAADGVTGSLPSGGGDS